MSDSPPKLESLWTPQVVVAAGVLLIVAGTVAGVFVKADITVITAIAGVVVGTGFGSVCGFYFGSSQGSERKTDLLAASKKE